MTTIGILSPGFPSIPGGVTDHAHRLVRGWTAAGHTVRAYGDPSLDPDAIAAELEPGAALLIEYVPFLYARRGLSSYPERVARAAAARGVRVTVFVHEPWVPMTRLPWLVLGPLQRRQLRRLVRVAHATVTAVPAWKTLLGRSTALVYVGSNLGPVPGDTLPGPLPAPVVFSPTAAGLRFDWIAAAAHAIGASPGLILVGTDAGEARHHPQLAPHFDASWDWRGRLPAPEVLRVLARARLVLAPYADGPTGRRTTLLAALSTGARVLSCTGPLLDPLFRDGPITLARNATEFAGLAQRLWREPDPPTALAARLDWYRRHLDPDMLDARLLSIVTGTT